MQGKGNVYMKNAKKILLLSMAVILAVAGGCGSQGDGQDAAREELIGIKPGTSVDQGGENADQGGENADQGGESVDQGGENVELEQILRGMTLEEKVAQLFVILPEALTGTYNVTAAGEKTKQAFDAMPVGGLIYMESNLKSSEQVKEMLANVQQYSQARTGLPAFLCVDEEGGTVARIAKQPQFGVANVGNMADIGATGDTGKAYAAGETISAYLAELGFNVDFAPVADVWDNPANTVVRYRAFGTDPQLVADMSVSLLDGLRKNHVLGAMKHFPGHGATEADTHAGCAYTDKTLEELWDCELVPFQAGIAQDVDFIMVGHISLPQVTGDNTPASLSRVIVTDILREKMKYDGLVITDALNMGAVTQNHSSSEAAVKALEAGVDILLMPKDFQTAYQGVLEAVRSGVLSEARIDESVRRVLRVKLEKL